MKKFGDATSEEINHRALELLQVLRQMGGSARTSNLAQRSGVSQETVRRGLTALERAGLIEREHGGARLLGGQDLPLPVPAGGDFIARLGENASQKRRIAGRVLQEIADGDTVFLDVSTTTGFVAAGLVGRQALTVVTNGLGPALALAGQNGTRLELLGGEMHDGERGAFGPETMAQALAFAIDVAVFSVDAFDTVAGGLYHSAAEAALAATVARHARRVVLAVTEDKMTRAAGHLGLRLDHIDLLICDAPLPLPVRAALRAAGGHCVDAGPENCSI